ncbi:tyrosine-type recombinase/integrase [Actinosynnema sp. CS-041913]|uniref:tyrosine-type recombinase/integrase n=1 Tax=Actinosynnema sp. CS-041913 TaxID=3239917 RepID=UPI003D8AEA2E
MGSDRKKVRLLREVGAAMGVPRSAVAGSPVVPKVGEYLLRVRAAATPSQLQRYRPYWRRAEEAFGRRRLDRVGVTDILGLKELSVARARVRANSRGGRYAGEACVRAMRLVFKLATLDGFVARESDPARKVALPRRLPSTRRALQREEIAQLAQAVVTGGHDVALDSLLFRLHLETACRRGGALNLRLADLDVQRCAVRLREKGSTHRWQPVSPTLAAALHEHAALRGATRPGDALLRTTRHTPATGRRYDLLWKRVRAVLPWAASLGVSAHWLRHSTLTWVERSYSYAVARAYAGHTDAKGAPTATYTKGLPVEVATALADYTGEAHPLAEAA